MAEDLWMNATELADYLDNNVEAMIMSEQTHIDQAATMLRQQQAEIEALKNAKRFIQNFAEEQHHRACQLEEAQEAEIEELKTCLIVEQEHNERMVEDRSKYEALAHTGGVEAGKELAVMEVMSENCTCYKLGYNPLNDYRKVKAK
jgi:hypothetical protein